LGKVTTIQADQQSEMAQLTTETYSLLENYQDIVRHNTLKNENAIFQKPDIYNIVNLAIFTGPELVTNFG
jgi:hypothetical protein